MLSKALNAKLSIRTGISIALFACFFLLISAVVLFQLSYKEELDEIHKNLQQLVKTVEQSAKVAVYLENEELGTEITNGLIINDNVSGVILNSDIGMLLTAGDISIGSKARLVVLKLNDPFTPELPIGKLTLIPNQGLIEATAKNRALSHIIIFGVNSIFVVFLVIILVNRLLAAPLKKIAQQLHVIKPGTSQRIITPKGHEQDEIGLLVNDSNNLLRAMQKTIQQKNQLFDEVQKLEKKFRLLFDNARVGIALVNMDGQLLMNNPAFANIVGEKACKYFSENQTQKLIELFEERQQLAKAIQKALTSTNPVSLDLSLKHEDEADRHLHCILSQVLDESGEVLLELVIYDISERVHRELKARYESEVDTLTGLLNRRGCKRLIKESLIEKPNSHHAIMLIDLDHFKPINDTYGHDAGDHVLKEVSNRFNSALRRSDLLSRWGGDEFLIFLAGDADNLEAEASAVAKKILTLLEKEIEVGLNKTAHVGASIGIALAPRHGNDLNALIKAADITMYQIKKQGKNNYLIYDETMVMENTG
ncbi:diguanylate cyclase domain-containing protein [Neptuniibacter sp. QD34_54]|uniref:diguanylate cyclase domain-containing protein n=1 Tax=Neptuniibacter sp. QD34_54 TaxID=3398208 RepID=UPI0039F4E048